MHPLFMHPSSIGRTTSRQTTYIQNNFYGGSSNQSVWGCCGNRVMMRPEYYQPNYCNGGFMSYMPHWVQNAATRLMSFNLIQSMFNPTAAQDMTSQYQAIYNQQQQLLAAQTSQLQQQQQLLGTNPQSSQTVGTTLTDQVAQLNNPTDLQA